MILTILKDVPWAMARTLLEIPKSGTQAPERFILER